LIFIKANCGNKPSCIIHLVASGIPLVEAVGNNTKTCILNNTSNYEEAIKNKLEIVLEKNCGYTAKEMILTILEARKSL